MSNSSNLSGFNGARIALKLIVFVAIVGIAYVWRPLFHGLFYRVVYSPGALLVFGLPILAGAILWFAPPLRSSNHESSVMNKLTLVVIVFGIGFALSLVVAVPGAMYEEKTLAQQTMEDSNMVEEFPEANEENPRIAPRAVADVQTSGSISYRQHELGASDISRMDDGRLAWSYPIQPNQFRNQLQDNQRGVLLTDMTAMEDREMAAYDETEFKHGQSMLFHRSADWNLKKSDYWAQYRDDPIEFTHEGQPYMAFPKTGHEWKLSPIPHTVPTWEGVALVHADGTIENLSPEEAKESEILDGQRLYPLYNAERNAESLQYRNGIWNQMSSIGTFEGVVEPAGLPSGASNSQPFVIDLAGEQMSYVYAMEASGDDNRGLDEVWFFDSKTGESIFYRTGGETLLGPERAMGIVRSEDTRTDWNTEDTSGEFQVVEPVPTVIDDELWWHAKVVPVDNTDVTRNSFVNAHTDEVVELHDTEAVIEFMSGEDVEDIDDAEEVTTEDSEEDDGVAYYIVIEDEDGEVLERIPVESGQEAVIEHDTDDEETEGDN